MKDKEKQIEEMAKDLKEEKLYALINKTSYMRSAENLYELGYRKLPKDEIVISKMSYEHLLKCEKERDILYEEKCLQKENDVVLSRDDYEAMQIKIEQLTKYAENERQLREYYCNESRKEMAEKFLQLAYDRCLEKSFIKKVEELAKSLGVEIKE